MTQEEVDEDDEKYYCWEEQDWEENKYVYDTIWSI